MRLLEFQNNNKKTKKLKSEILLEGGEDIDEVLHYQGVFYVPKVICSKLINKHYNNPLKDYFGTKKHGS